MVGEGPQMRAFAWDSGALEEEQRCFPKASDQLVMG